MIKVNHLQNKGEYASGNKKRLHIGKTAAFVEKLRYWIAFTIYVCYNNHTHMKKEGEKNMLHTKNRIYCCLMSIVLVLAMLLSLVGCDPTTTDPTVTQPSTQGTTTQPSSEPTDPSSTPTQPSEPSTPTEPSEPESNELIYELTQEDVDAYYQYLDACEELSIIGEDLDAIDEATEKLDESYEYLNAQCSIATILHYSHTKDKNLEKQYLDATEIATQANDAYVQMARRVYLSDSPAKDHLFEGWTEADFANLLNYDEKIAQLQQRNAEIGVEYRAAKDDQTKIALYIEFVQNNNEIAEVYGYDNYYTCAYEMVYERDYDADALNQMRQYAKTYLTDSYIGAATNFNKSFYEELGSGKQMQVQRFLFNDYNRVSGNYVNTYFDALPQEMGDVMRTMLKKDSLFTNASDAMPGAFTTAIGDRSYCYFGPGYASCGTVIHESGHYFASRYCDLGEIPLDLAETHSQSNEWLFAYFLSEKMSADQYAAVVDYWFYEDISTILICLMVDEFEQRVYSADLTGFTAADFDAIMDEVALQYFPKGNVKQLLTDVNYYWRQVVVDQPVYYISYAVSAVASMSLYTMAQNDFDAAVEVYRKLCQEPVEDAGFLGNIQSAGLSSPFDEEFYIQLQKLIAGRQ